MSEGLERFVAAQERVWPAVQAELQAGAKRSHWMWFVFPQILGLGQSATSVGYGIDGLAEAQAYVAHPLLGPRLLAAAALVLAHAGRPAESIFGGIDAMKLRSSMTLFEAADPRQPAFGAVLAAFFGGTRDPLTLSLLKPV